MLHCHTHASPQAPAQFLELGLLFHTSDNTFKGSAKYVLDKRQQHAVGVHVSFCVPLKLLMSDHNPHQQLHVLAVATAAAAASGHLYSGIVGNQAAIHKGAHARLRLIWCRVDESSCRAQPCQYTYHNGQTASSTAATFIHQLRNGVHLGRGKQKGGGEGETWCCRGLVNMALLLLCPFQVMLLVYRGLQEGEAGATLLAGRQGWGYTACRLW